MPIKKSRAEMEHFHSYLREKGLKKTYQKDLILETFLNTEGHLSVEDVYAQVKKKDKKVGIVTVFRTLRSLKECGLAREITLGDGLTRFEHCYQLPYHHHIVCTKCHRAIEFICPELERIQDAIIQKYRFKPEYHRFQTVGVCEDCLENRTVAAAEKHDTGKVFARDALRMALTIGNRCLAFWLDTAHRNMEPGGKDVFKRMALHEEGYITELNSKLEELNRQEKDLDRAPVFLHFDEGEFETLFPDLSGYRKEEGLFMDSRAAMEVSSRLNRKASEFFNHYAESFPDPFGKQLFLNYAGRGERNPL